MSCTYFVGMVGFASWLTASSRDLLPFVKAIKREAQLNSKGIFHSLHLEILVLSKLNLENFAIHTCIRKTRKTFKNSILAQAPAYSNTPYIQMSWICALQRVCKQSSVISDFIAAPRIFLTPLLFKCRNQGWIPRSRFSLMRKSWFDALELITID